MEISLKNYIYEKVKHAKNISDVDLINDLSKKGTTITMSTLNKILLSLEIIGLITVRWTGKDKRRIDILESKDN